MNKTLQYLKIFFMATIFITLPVEATSAKDEEENINTYASPRIVDLRDILNNKEQLCKGDNIRVEYYALHLLKNLLGHFLENKESWLIIDIGRPTFNGIDAWETETYDEYKKIIDDEKYSSTNYSKENKITCFLDNNYLLGPIREISTTRRSPFRLNLEITCSSADEIVMNGGCHFAKRIRMSNLKNKIEFGSHFLIGHSKTRKKYYKSLDFSNNENLKIGDYFATCCDVKMLNLSNNPELTVGCRFLYRSVCKELYLLNSADIRKKGKDFNALGCIVKTIK